MVGLCLLVVVAMIELWMNSGGSGTTTTPHDLILNFWKEWEHPQDLRF
jgi:hypothetical protein